MAWRSRGSSDVVIGNRIGTRADGTGDLGNGRDGVFIIGGNNNTIGGSGGSGNLISGNDEDGIVAERGSLTIGGNSIVANGGSGILVTAARKPCESPATRYMATPDSALTFRPHSPPMG